MNQDKTQKTFKRQVISQDAQFSGGYRKNETPVPASTMSFSKQFLPSDSREENFGSFKVSNGSKLYSIPGTGITGDQIGNLKQLPINVEVKKNGIRTDEKEAEMEMEMETETEAEIVMGTEMESEKKTTRGAAIWDGPLSRYNTLMSNKSPEECMKAIGRAVAKLEEEDTCLDWKIEEYIAFGRMYHELDISEFIINVYKSSDNQFQSVIEIRRSSGDTFVHDEFFRQIAQSLENDNILEPRRDEPKIDFSLSMALEPLSIDSLAQLDTLDTNFLKELTSNDGMSSDETSISDITEIPSFEQLGDELIDIVTDRTSYQDVFRHSSGILCQELKNNIPLLQYVASQTDIIERLIKPLTQDFYDTLIIRNILQVVKQLLQNQNPKVFVHANCSKEIEDLKITWADSVQHKSINMKFCKSQQVEKLCSECLELLKNRV